MKKKECAKNLTFDTPSAFLEFHSVIEIAKKHNQTPYAAIQTLFGA